jgi:hypothetical protein
MNRAERERTTPGDVLPPVTTYGHTTGFGHEPVSVEPDDPIVRISLRQSYDPNRRLAA